VATDNLQQRQFDVCGRQGLQSENPNPFKLPAALPAKADCPVVGRRGWQRVAALENERSCWGVEGRLGLEVCGRELRQWCWWC